MRVANASLLVVLGRVDSAAIDAPCVLEELGSRTPDDVDLVLGHSLRRRRRGPPSNPYPSRPASAMLASFWSDWLSTWRMRSRVTLNIRPSSSSVRGFSPPRPYRSSS